MPRDAKSKMSINKKRQNKKTEELAKKRKKNQDSDDDIELSSEEEEEDEDVMDELEYKKFLKKLFPSKHMDKQVNATKRIKNIIQKEMDVEEEVEEEVNKKSNKKLVKKSNPKSKKMVKEQKEDSEEDSDEDEDYEEDSDYEEEEEEEDEKGSNKFNIIFTIGGLDGEEDEEWVTDEDYDDDKSDDATENEDESVSDSDEEEQDEMLLAKKKQPILAKKKESSALEEPKKNKVDANENEQFLLELKALQEKHQNNSIANECLKICESSLKETREKQERKNQKQKDKNGRIFKKIVRDKNTLNDFEFFKNLAVDEQKKIIKELREINKITRVEKPYRMTLFDADIPVLFKGAAMKKINTLRYMEPGSGEYYKIKNWVDTFMRIPFGKYEKLPVNIDNGIETCHDFMATAKETLNNAVYGLNDAKMQIMQMLGQLITNPASIGTAIAIHGSMGTGKTTLVKEGISKILNRPFAFIALGGATDSSFLEGHSYTYEGSTWGKIVQILIDSKCMNPVIYFDELDKISDTPKGEEIANILTHLTDTSQNSQFHDKYFAEVDFDMSKCLFIFSYNDEKKVSPILRDRMYRICTKGYDKKQKTVISNKYLLPKIREQVKFNDNDIIIPDETLQYIMDTHCNNEEGVRNLKRSLEIIHTKLNLYRLMKPGVNLFEEDMAFAVEFPFTVTRAIVDKLITVDRNDNMALKGMYV